MEKPGDCQHLTENGSGPDLTVSRRMPGDRQAAASLRWGIASVALVAAGAVLVALSDALHPQLSCETYGWLRLTGIVAGFLLGTWLSIPAVILGVVALARGTERQKRAIAALILGGLVFLYLFTVNAIGVYVSVIGLVHSPPGRVF